VKDDRPRLAEAGIDKNLAKRARKFSAMSEEDFEAQVGGMSSEPWPGTTS
jgi:hypothetical protein